MRREGGGWVGWWIVGSKSDRLPPREDGATSLPGSRGDLSRESSSFLSRIFLFKRDGDAGVRRWNDRMYHRMIYYRWLSSSDHLASAAVFNPLRLHPLHPRNAEGSLPARPYLECSMENDGARSACTHKFRLIRFFWNVAFQVFEFIRVISFLFSFLMRGMTRLNKFLDFENNYRLGFRSNFNSLNNFMNCFNATES